MKISLSFKENEKEIYDYLTSKLSASIYIKELILVDMKEKPEKRNENKKNATGYDFNF